MVFLGLNLSTFDAVCCSVLVIKGGLGLEINSDFFIEFTFKIDFFIFSDIDSAIFLFEIILLDFFISKT